MYSSSTSILDAEQRARRYWYADGIPTLVVGMGLVLCGFSLLSAQRETPLYTVASFAALGLYAVFVLKRIEIVDWLKSRFTYPRTGYVPPPVYAPDTSRPLSLGLSTPATDSSRDEEVQRVDWERHRRMGFAAAMVLLMQVAMMVIDKRWVFTVEGIVIAAALWIVRRDFRVSPVLLLGSPLLGLCTTLFVPSSQDRISYSLIGFGALFMLDGAIALIRHIGQNPAPQVPAA